ncbi:MAG: BatA and WFA domain-containing protein [Planctomycetaceae bacterium]|nr:BatA and WFA domain-containing protein [Planctomycetaceae bacterium]
MNWLTQYFLNPGFVLPGAALATVPIIIHILSRLRYRRIRFAAMEFLLQSDEMNRRRLILEQLLLLLLRILAVVLFVLLLGRMILDPSRMLLLRGASIHHVVVIDDTLSMRDRDDDGIVFDRCIETIEQMLSRASGQSGSARLTVMLMSDPARPLVSDRRIDAQLINELTPRLRNQRCSYRAATPVAAFSATRDLLSGESGVAPQVHVITDLRASDWVGQPEVIATLEALKSVDARVDLVRVSRDSHANVAIQQMNAATLAVARGIPWRLDLTIVNHSTVRQTGLRGTVLVDGNALPASLLLPDLEPASTTTVSHDITFESEGRHQVEIRLDDDDLPDDNRRFVTVDVTDRRSVLMIDDDGQQEDAAYVASALSADPDLTGIAVTLRSSQALEAGQFSQFDCIYLLNVRDLPADIVRDIADYVRDGGGIAWFPGDQANTAWYTDTLTASSNRLFPVPLGTVYQNESQNPLQESSAESQTPVFEQHPVFLVYNLPDSPFAELIRIAAWFQVTDDWERDDRVRDDGVRTLARLRDGSPIIFEHTLGKGRILTFLTGAGRRWSNWPLAPASPGYVVTHLLIHQYLQKPAVGVESRELAEPLQLEWSPGEFTEAVEVFLPEPDDATDATIDTFLRLQATLDSRRTPENAIDNLPSAATDGVSKESSADLSSFDDSGDDGKLIISVPQANRPGVYRIRRFRPTGDQVESWIAMNVPGTESNLAIADPVQVTTQGELDHVIVREPDTAALGASDAGRELRWILLLLLLGILIAEQLLSLHMSYHPGSAQT